MVPLLRNPPAADQSEHPHTSKTLTGLLPVSAQDTRFGAVWVDDDPDCVQQLVSRTGLPKLFWLVPKVLEVLHGSRPSIHI